MSAEEERAPRLVSTLIGAAPATRAALLGLGVLWLAAMSQLMIADVWDETRALNLVRSSAVLELFSSDWQQTWGSAVTLVRPLPFALVAMIARGVSDYDLTWQLLRWLNAALVLAAVAVLLAVIRRWRGEDGPRDLLFALVVLGSGSAAITASWFANIFDGCVLFLVACGLWRLAGGRAVAAGALFGAAFLCKETAVLVFPLLLALGLARRVKRRPLLVAGGVAAAVFAAYLAGRSLIVPLGSVDDLHGFSVGAFMATLGRLPEALWWQVADPPVRWVGWAVFAASLVAVGSRRAAAGAAALVGVSVLIYTGMIHLGPAPLISAANFAGRLYLAPAALLAFLIAARGRRYALLVVLVPALWGGAVTFAHHLRFQHAYARLYAAAAVSFERPFVVDSPAYPRSFHDRRRGIVLGPFPDAGRVLAADGSLTARE